MMLIVIVVFMLCWTPLYCESCGAHNLRNRRRFAALYCYFFLATNHNTPLFQFASHVLRPVFQGLSLLSSSLNPLIYITYSQKYRAGTGIIDIKS